jgi:hypothetical protein
VADANGVVIHSQSIGVEKSTMIHSFAITEQDVVFWELPVLFSLDAAIAGADNPYSWQPDYGARIGVMPLGGTADQIRWVEITPCYVFHEVNAHRDGSEVVIDVCRHPDMFNGTDLGEKPHTITRWRIDTAGETLRFREERVSDLQYELPTHDRRFTGRKQRYGWFVAHPGAPGHGRPRWDRSDRFRERASLGLGCGDHAARRRSVLRPGRLGGGRRLPVHLRLRPRDRQEHARGARRDQGGSGTGRRDRAAAARAARFHGVWVPG